jgi:hypothetical protein
MTKQLLTARPERPAEVAAVLVSAVLMVVSALVHIHLWDIAYRHVATLGPLFLVQAVAALVAAVALAATRWPIVAAGSALLMAGTVVGFVIAATVGLFGFKLPSVTGWADLALATEVVSAGALAAVVLRAARAAPGRT